MSVNPVVAAAGAAGANVPVEQLIAAELTALAAEAQALQGQLTTGQVVTAQVLPSNGLTDLINILGNRVAAALPPNLQPGDLFTAQVTGFNGPQILLQILGTPEPGQLTEAPPPVSTSPLETLPAEPLSALAAAGTRPMLPDGVAPSLSPPPAVFVAASVRPAPVNADGSPARPPVSTPSPQVIVPPPTALADIEARLAAARAGSIGVNVPNAPPATAASAPAAPLPAGSAAPSAQLAPPPANASPQAPTILPPTLPGRFVIAPTIVPSARFAENAAPSGPAASAGTPATPAPTGLAAYRDPAALVRALSLPVTPTNIAAARLALDTPQRLPAALATLESALPELDDPRVATLRTLTAFIGKIEPGSPQLAAQISAFVDNVVTGNEPKLSQLLAAQLAAEQPAAEQSANAPVSTPASQTANAQAGAPPAAPQPTLPVTALAQVAERGAALSVDLKTQLLALINAPPGAEGDDLVPAASSALTAITAVQMNAAQALNVSPQTMAFTLPMWLGSGYAQARIAIDRDAPEPNGHRGLDGDNFHIAFVLDTKHLGTVTVDLQTVGRAFSLAVKAENEGSAKRFGDAIGRLTGRLETLRYRVNSAEATVAPRGSAATGAMTAPAPTIVEPEDDGGIASDVNVRA
jgi:hypothetical protein